MAEHTPGPWEMAGESYAGIQMISCGHVSYLVTDGSVGGLLDRLNDYEAKIRDLLEALQRLFEWERDFWDVQPKAKRMGLPEIEFPESSGYMDNWLEKNIDGPVKAAIAKATGQETFAP